MSDIKRMIDSAADLVESRLDDTDCEYAVVVAVSRPSPMVDCDIDTVISGTSASHVAAIIASLLHTILDDDRLTDRQKLGCGTAYSALVGAGFASTRFQSSQVLPG
jgi:hypothetical protein